ncbi:MAG: TonB-dependent receptor [Prolixibacteraceae bacterium]|nr:TonB-dependent receptor [Prolixibacteraceae bacterium]
MKKIAPKGLSHSAGLKKLLLTMKLTIFLVVFTVLQTIAGTVLSQTSGLTLNVKQTKVEQILLQIENQSNYVFLYNKDLIDVEKEASINVKSASVEEVLKMLFEDSNVNYRMVGRQIVLSPTYSQQQKKVTGKVTDANGEPIPGVAITVKGTTNGTITSVDGTYEITKVDESAMLVYSFVGLKSQEISAQGKTVINVVLEEEKTDLDEVIVIGYGTAKRQDYSGSVSSVKMEGSAISQLPNLNALESLKGNVAGLNIGATNSAGGQPSMEIRGQNSISGDNNPLIVLDGIIYLGSLNDINPNDIASYDILKDAVSAAAYGSRSSNGVIAITTKKGSNGKPVITFNTSAGVQSWQNQPVMMKGEEWIKVVNARNKYAEGSTNWMKTGELANLAAGTETNWLDQVTQTGIIQDYQIAVSGAAQAVNYYVSASYNDNKGIVVGDDFNRISLLGKVNTTITNWLKVGLDASYSRRDYSGFAANVGEAQTMSPYGVMFRDDKGNLEKYPYTQSAMNPLWGVDDYTRDNKDIRNNYRLNAYAIVDVPWIKGLNYKINIQSNLDQNQSGNFYNENYYIKEGEGLARYEPATVVGFLASANGNIDNNKTFSYVFDNILNYKQTFEKHSVEGTLVATRDYRRYEQVNSTGSDFGANGNTTLGMWGIHKATVQKVNLNADQRANIGYLGRVTYSFADKYFFTGSYRRDGASVFGANKKWGNFAAAGVAWKITNEEFLKSFKPLNNLKLKLSWGQNGSQGTGPYATLSTIANSSSGDIRYEFSNAQGKINYGLFQATLGNPDIGWESTETWNTGFESAWLNNRLFADLDVYVSKTTDQLFTRNIPVMSGFKTIRTAMGQVNNAGVELTLRSVNVKTKDLNWTTSVTYWINRNKLVKLYGEDKNNDGVEDDDIASSLFIGKSLSAIYGYEQEGIVQAEDTEYKTLTGAADGAPKYKDLDGVAGITSADRKILGYGKENFRLNMSNSVTYKNFELYAMITGVFGGNGYFMKSNTAAYMTSGTGRFNDNMTSKPYWTPENKSNVYPSAYFAGDGRYLALQSRGFVRVQDVSLSYTFNQPFIKTAQIKSLKVFLSAKNLATITNWFGGDPEVGTPVRENTFPVPSTYSIGANISF